MQLITVQQPIFHLGCTNLDDQTRSGKLTTGNFETELQSIKVNTISNTRSVSGELGGISQSTVVRHLHDLSKNSRAVELYLTLLE